MKPKAQREVEVDAPLRHYRSTTTNIHNTYEELIQNDKEKSSLLSSKTMTFTNLHLTQPPRRSEKTPSPSATCNFPSYLEDSAGLT